MDVEQLKLNCKGRWVGIFSSFGINIIEKKHAPCFICGGKDRFIYTNNQGNGDYYCNQCGPGDGIGLIQKTINISFTETIKRISDIVGGVKVDSVIPNNVNAKKLLNDIWKTSKKLIGDDPVLKYLHSRKVVVRPDNVRFCPNCYESDTKKKYPAMVAMIQSSSGKAVSIHRTYLNGVGKADIESPRKIMPSVESLQGSAVRLFKPGDTIFEENVLGVAEGIETALSAAQLFSVATWSVLNTSLMESFVPPKEYREIVIFGDSDPGYAGQKSAYILANRLYNAGLLVRVEIPEKTGFDWNDVLMGIK